MEPENHPTNYRQTRRKHERQLLGLVMVMLVVVGGGLIGLIWGVQAALVGSACLLAGALLIGGLWLMLGLIQRWVEE